MGSFFQNLFHRLERTGPEWDIRDENTGEEGPLVEDMDAVYRQHAQTVYKFLLSQCHDPHLAEELTQETFYQAVRSSDRFDGGGKVSVWPCGKPTGKRNFRRNRSCR